MSALSCLEKLRGGISKTQLLLISRVKTQVIGLTLLFIVVWQSPPLQPLHGLEIMPLWLHTLMETFAITIAVMTFGIVWNARIADRPGNLMILGCAFLAAGLIDFAHILSYQGMPEFITPAGVEKAINFWLAARLIMAMALLTIALRPWHSFASSHTPRLLLLSTLGMVSLVWWLVLFHPELWPRTFIAGRGLTPFKIGVEYLIVTLMAGAALMFHLRARRVKATETSSLMLATLITILSELCFTLYSDATDLMNLLGHLYKVVAYFFFYRAVFVHCVHEPFRKLQAEIEQHSRTGKALADSERYNRLLFEMSPIGLVLSRPDGSIVDINAAYARILGREVEEAKALNIAAITAPEYAEQDRQRHSSLAATGHYEPCEKEYFHKDGHRVPVRLQGVLFEKNDEPHVWSSVEDISEQKAARDAILKLNESLERRVAERTKQLTEANKELEAFSYSVSHDLRAPLRGIDGFSQVLLKRYAEKLDDTGRDYLGRMRRASQRMGELIDDLLNLSRVTRSPLRRQEVNLSLLATNLVQDLQRATPERRVSVKVQQDISVFGDPGLLRVVLDNLLGNAWKFTRHTAEARIEFGCQEKDGELVYFVRDNGAGYDSAYAKKLFQVFQRLHSDSEFEGTGIGLATVSRIIQRHHGAVHGEGETGSGATFYFTLPQRIEGRDDETDTEQAQIPTP